MSKIKRLNRHEAIELIEQRAGCSRDEAEGELCTEMMLGRLTYDNLRDRERPFDPAEIERLWPAGDPPNATRDPRGRPRVIDRDAAFIELIRLASTPDGLPESQAMIKRHLKDWFAGQDQHPSDTWIDEVVGKVIAGLKAR
jgi:hypothetical protein